MASNGDTISVRAQGNLDTEEPAVSGGGTFEHRNSAGTLLGSGTLTAKRLLAFSSYGCGGSGLPSNFCGGRAVLLVHLVGHPAGDPSKTIKADGTLIVTCVIGNPPAGAHEGITLNIKNVDNFNQSVIGDTLFIQTDEEGGGD
jgi:hypothetical protein